MTTLFLAKSQRTYCDFESIKAFLNGHKIDFERWEATQELSDSDNQETILKAYEHELKPFMQTRGFQSADVINVNPKTENIEEIRQKFLKEHTHSEDEVRFFVDGQGKFWFHFDDEEVACLTCERGDFLAVPKGYKHWFDLAPQYFVKAIRIFTDKEGWVAHYTGSGIDSNYNS